MKILEVKNLSIDIAQDKHTLSIVDNLSFEVNQGEIVALVGESGCGKSLSCMALADLLPHPPMICRGDKIELATRNGKLNILTGSKRELAAIRGREISYIFQEPSTSLNPVFRVGNQIVEALQLHQPELADPMSEAVQLLKSVGIPDPQSRVKAYPHELSGGMQQRVMIAMALACKPRILVADEPTTALDVTIQQQILQLLRKLRQEQKLAIILVTHNLGVVAELADRVLVMYAGQLVENMPVSELPAAQHPYTKALLKAVPRLGAPGRLHNIPGTVPPPAQYPAGCRFYSRCSIARQLSAEEQRKCSMCKAPLHLVKPNHELRCHYFEQLPRGEE